MHVPGMGFAAILLLLCGTANDPGTRGLRPQAGMSLPTWNELGIMEDIPPQGTWIATKPARLLKPGSTECYRLEFRRGETLWRGVARPGMTTTEDARPIEAVEFQRNGPGWRCLTRLDKVEIRSRFRPVKPPFYVLTVQLRNTSDQTLTDVAYEREWSFPAEGASASPDLTNLGFRIDDLPPRSSAEWNLGIIAPDLRPPAPTDVPLRVWVSEDWPTGVNFGLTNGITVLDFDGDGWSDVYASASGNLWHNDAAVTWTLHSNLEALGVIPPTVERYGATAGDYDADGDVDLATEPRTDGVDSCFHLLRNMGSGQYEDVAGDADVLLTGQPCDLDAETGCLADVNGDGFMDLFLPVYPPSSGGGMGNQFFVGLGPATPGGPHRFQQATQAAGLGNPPGVRRPEGAQFADVDRDGDLDLYSNGTLYLNQSTPGVASFAALAEADTGIGLSSSLDEGALFFDRDRDGDLDLLVTYVQLKKVTIWDNRGDGSFVEVPPNTIEWPTVATELGCSAADWDNDGDIDFTCRYLFRQNQLVETGTANFLIQVYAFPQIIALQANPGWVDWDRDGDLDCALGNWRADGSFLENTTYNAATEAGDRRTIRVRPCRRGPGDQELEVEWGSAAQLTIHGEADLFQRREFNASAEGYLSQSEYSMHFALPPDPDPGDPAVDLVFDLSVDFPGVVEQGLWRVDRHVNPILGDIAFATLSTREVVVFRDGTVRLDGKTYRPSAHSPALVTLPRPLDVPQPGSPLAQPTSSPGPNWFIGIDLDTLGATHPQRIREVVLDGQLDAAVTCGTGTANLYLWDITQAGQPQLLDALERSTHPGNHRSIRHCSIVLPPDRRFRLVAQVTALRANAIVAPIARAGLKLRGGISFANANPCDGTPVEIASLDPTQVSMAVRISGPRIPGRPGQRPTEGEE